MSHRIAACTALCLGLALPAHAQEAGLKLELNTAADAEGACRITLLAENGTDKDLTKLAYEVAAFDPKGTVMQMLVLEMGALGKGRSKVLQFDIPGGACAALGKLQVNRSDACDSADGPLDICLKDLKASSKLDNLGFGA